MDLPSSTPEIRDGHLVQYSRISPRGSSRPLVACHFTARVLKVKDGQLQIDAGAESGVSVGDTMSLHQWKEPPVRRHDQTVLGREKFVRTTVRIRSVYPNFSVGELVEAPAGLKAASVTFCGIRLCRESESREIFVNAINRIQ